MIKINNMNSTKYINHTIFSTDSKNKSDKKEKIDLTPLKDIIPQYYKYLSLKRLTEIYQGKHYKDKNLEIECKKDYWSRDKIIKIRLHIQKNKLQYYNIYLPLNYHKINDIIFLINLTINEFNFKKELDMTVYIHNIPSRLKNLFWSYDIKWIHLKTAISKFADNEKEISSQTQEIKNTSESLDSSIFEDIDNTIESTIESNNSTIEDMDKVYEIVNELDGLIKNIHTTLNKYE